MNPESDVIDIAIQLSVEWVRHGELLSNIEYTCLGKHTHNADNDFKIISNEKLSELYYFKISDFDYNKFKDNGIKENRINILIKAEVNARITALQEDVYGISELDLIEKACNPKTFKIEVTRKQAGVLKKLITKQIHHL
ncbi:MAG: hypothetical protein ACYDCN_05085 [Bacteroidia bacterium]